MAKSKTFVPDAVKNAVKGVLGDLRQAVDFRVRLDAYRVVFEKLDRILTGRQVNVVVADPQAANLKDAPGWTDGETVFLNGPLLQRDLQALRGKDITPLVMSLKGVNYHELSHVLYSPRIADDVCKRVVERAQDDGDFRWWYSFNALEDQRIETWFTATYRPATRYFEAIALKWLVSNQQHLADAYILIYGRKFLPAKVRLGSRKAFVQKYTEDLAQRFEKLIDQYLLVAYPQDTNRGYKLIAEYRALLDEAMMLNPPDLLTADNDPNNIPHKGQQRDDLIKRGRAMHKDQKQARERARDVVSKAQAEDKELQKQDQSKPSDPQPSAEQQQGQGDGQGGSGQGEQPQQGQAGQTSGDGSGDDGTANDNPVNQPGAEVGAGNGVNTASGDAIRQQDALPAQKPEDVLQDAVDAMYDALDEALNDPDLIEDVKATAQAIRAAGLDGEMDVQGRGATYKEAVVDSHNKVVSRRIVHVLEQLRLDLEPMWHHRAQRGRVNVKRVLTRQPWQTDIFDLWDEGNEEQGGIEAVVLIDMSGSMSHLIYQASEALWALKRAFDQLDIRTTVLGYSDSHIILYRPGDKVTAGTFRSFGTYNSTNPTSALREAHAVLAKSSKPNKLLVTITDGQWGGNDTAILGTVKAIQRLGTTTMLLGLSGAIKRYGKHGHELGRDMDNIKELPDIVNHAVVNILQRVAARA